MQYKKCDCKKCQSKKSHQEFDVAYYEVKKSDNSNKCKCDIEKTEGLIEAVEHKAQEVLCDIVKADQEVDQIAEVLKQIPDLSTIAHNLACYAADLQKLAEALALISPEQINLACAIMKQEELLRIVDCLEDQFDKTVCCLKKENGGYPILVPVEKDGCHKDCDC